jgi:hypothetical protein
MLLEQQSQQLMEQQVMIRQVHGLNAQSRRLPQQQQLPPLLQLKLLLASTSEVHYVDKIAFHAGDEPFWTRGGFSTFSFDVERSDDSGTNLLAIRNSPVTASTSQIATLAILKFRLIRP